MNEWNTWTCNSKYKKKKASLILNATQLNSNINCTFQNCTNDLLHCVLTLMWLTLDCCNAHRVLSVWHRGALILSTFTVQISVSLLLSLVSISLFFISKWYICAFLTFKTSYLVNAKVVTPLSWCMLSHPGK